MIVMCHHSQVRLPKAQYIAAGRALHNYFEMHCCNRLPCYHRIDRYRIRARHLVQNHGHPHSAEGDPDPDPSGASGHRHVQRNLDRGHGHALVPGRGQDVEPHPTPDKVRVLRD